MLDYDVSPDGTAIVYSALREDGGADLWLVGTDGRESRLLLACPGQACTAPDWAPDDRIAYERRDMGEGADEPHVWLVDPADGATVPAMAGDRMVGMGPRWSPRGEGIVTYDPLEAAVVILDQGAGTSRRFSSRAGLSGVWSPAGDRVLTSDLIIGDAVGYHLYAVEAVGDGQANLSGDDALVQDGWPAWSPDGEWIAFVRRELAGPQATLGQQVWLMRADGSDARAVWVDAGATFSWVAWRPDGQALACVRRLVSDPNARPELWLAPFDGEPVQVIEAGTTPIWLP